MKRKLISLLLTGALVMSGSVMAFAAEDTAKATAPIQEKTIAPDMNFVGEAINLTLDQAIEQMLKDSSSAKIAQINKVSARATAAGQGETASQLKKILDMGGATVDLSEVDRLSSKKLEAFATEQGALNYEAEINKLKADTVKTYYSTVQAKELAQIKWENVLVQEKLLTNIQKKFDLGMVAKQEVLQGQLAVTTAKNESAAAQNTLALAKMGLNQYLGYDVMQKVNLTSSLKEVGMPTITLGDAVEKGLKSRNEIKGSLFSAELQEMQLKKNAVRYPTNSAKYLNQEVATLKAQQSAKDAVTGIEMDIRNKYMTMNDKKDAVISGKEQLALAQEAVRLTNLTYDAGMAVLTDVQKAENSLMLAKLGLSQALLDYNLAVQDFEESYGIGRTAIPLG